jgi:hypothetical protein
LGVGRRSAAAVGYLVAMGAVGAAWAALDSDRWTLPALIAVAVLSAAWGAVAGLLAPAGPAVAFALWGAVALAASADPPTRGIAVWVLVVGLALAELCAVLGALVRAYVALAPERGPDGSGGG